jgi:hypothetical protein
MIVINDCKIVILQAADFFLCLFLSVLVATREYRGCLKLEQNIVFIVMTSS